MTKTQTEYKLREAGYFLSRIAEIASTESFHTDDFMFNLSAFLSAARSVTLIMQSEFSKNQDFRKWYEGKQNQLKTDPLFKYFNEHRRLLIHERPLQGQEGMTIIVDKESGNALGVYQTCAIMGTDNLVQFNEKPKRDGSKHNLFFSDYSDMDADQLCRNYYEKLKQLVLDVKYVLKIE